MEMVPSFEMMRCAKSRIKTCSKEKDRKPERISSVEYQSGRDEEVVFRITTYQIPNGSTYWERISFHYHDSNIKNESASIGTSRMAIPKWKVLKDPI